MEKAKEELKKLYYVFQDYEKLKKIARRLHRLDENTCNYGLTKRQEKRVEKLEKEAKEIANRLGLDAYHQGDPRGATLWLIPKDLENPNACHSSEGIPII